MQATALQKKKREKNPHRLLVVEGGTIDRRKQ